MLYFDCKLNSTKTSSGGDGISLPDMRTSGSGGVAVHLTQGRLSGMANWSRWGDAKLETK